VRGRLTLDGAPAANAHVTFWLPDAKTGKKMTRVTDSFVDVDGTFTASTYVNNDGLPEGEYRVTVAMRQPFFDPSGKLGKNSYPEKYASPQTTPLTAKITSGANDITIDLTK
jgi:hypothetical protein